MLILLMAISTSAFALARQPYSPARIQCEGQAFTDCNIEVFGDASYRIY